MGAPLSDQDKIFKAQAIQQKLQLETDLASFSTLVNELFKVNPPMKLSTTDRAELDSLRAAIGSAADANNQRARILELITKGLRAI